MKTYVKPNLNVSEIVNGCDIATTGLAGWLEEETGLTNANITTYVMVS